MEFSNCHKVKANQNYIQKMNKVFLIVQSQYQYKIILINKKMKIVKIFRCQLIKTLIKINKASNFKMKKIKVQILDIPNN